MKIFVILLLLVITILANDENDYYKILGVKRDATED